MRFQTRWRLIKETWFTFWILVPWVFRLSIYLKKNSLMVGIGDRRFGPLLEIFHSRAIGAKRLLPSAYAEVRKGGKWGHHYCFGNGCKRTAALWLVGKNPVGLDNDSPL